MSKAARLLVRQVRDREHRKRPLGRPTSYSIVQRKATALSISEWGNSDLGSGRLCEADFVCNGLCEKTKAAAEEAAELLESTYAAAASATTEYHLKIIEVGRANLNYWLRARPRTRKGRFGTMTEQGNDLAKLAPGVVMRTAEPAQFRVAAACKLFD